MMTVYFPSATHSSGFFQRNFQFMYDTRYEAFPPQSATEISTWPAAALIVHGHADTGNDIRIALSELCALIEIAHTPAQAEQLLHRYHFDVVIIDNRLPDIIGWIQALRSRGQRIPIILVTDAGEVMLPDEAAGVARSIPLQQVLQTIARALGQPEPAPVHSDCEAADCEIGTVVRHSDAMQGVFTLIRRIASRNVTVLLQGESGTGKEVAARCLHRFSGRSGAFVPVNCGAISPELLESELFGHVRGAFTGAHQARPGLFSHAEGGTLLLDEICEMPLSMQATLLRVLEERAIRPVGTEQEHAVNVRIVAATNRDMAEEVAQGSFREDLYYRLNVVSLRMPPLRERPDDIEHLVRLFSNRLAQELGMPPLVLDARELQRLRAHSWPGNVRELRNLVERAMLLDQSPVDCLESSATLHDKRLSAGVVEDGYPADLPLAEVERHHILKVLAASDGNKSEAGRRLGVSRKTLERKLKLWEAES
jgi:two-component system NtrC family response regulator